MPEWTLGDRLRKARTLTDMTTREFAEVIGVSQATITSAENDHRKVWRITGREGARRAHRLPRAAGASAIRRRVDFSEPDDALRAAVSAASAA